MIRQAVKKDFECIWSIFQPIARAGLTYAYDPAITKEQAYSVWMVQPRETYVIEEAGEILGTYYIKTNQHGPGSHVCNCGYMVAESGRGCGLATQMCEHSQAIAVELGYQAMQFNFVASTNRGAVGLWQKLGFEIVGTLPQAFSHPSQGQVDAYVMYKWLAD